MNGIFVSFRKDDARLLRQRVDEALTRRFGRALVFKSGESIAPGAQYPTALVEEARGLEIMLALIGPAWLGVGAGQDGGRRIDDEQDWVRREFVESHGHGNRVIPVLLGDGTRLPDAADLPEQIRALASLQCLRVSDTHTEADLDNLIERLIWILPALGRVRPEPPEPPAPAAGGGIDPAAAAATVPLSPPPIQQQLDGDYGANVSVGSGKIDAGGGTITFGGDHSDRSTTINRDGDGNTVALAAAPLAAAAQSASLLAVLKSGIATPAKAVFGWVTHHRAVTGGIGAIVAVGALITISILASPTTPASELQGAAATAGASGPSSPILATSAGPTGATASADGATPVPAAGTDTFSVEDANRDTWTATIAFGAPASGGSSAVQSVLDAASGCINGSAFQPDEMLVIPIRITYDLTSAEPLNNFDAGITAYSGTGGPAVVYRYGDGSYGCASLGLGSGDQISTLQPNRPASTRAWAVMIDSFNGQGQPNTSAIAGSFITVNAVENMIILSANGPDICGTVVVPEAILDTGLQSTNADCTTPGVTPSAS